MKRRLALFITASVLGFSFVHAQNIQFKNGYWLMNNRFVRKDVFSVNGIFSFHQPEKTDTTINLEGQYCIPPFSDAHTHNVDYTYNLKDLTKQYLKNGIFYVQVLGNHGKNVAAIREILLKEKKMDVSFANGLLTATYGHGFYPYEPMAMGIYSPFLQSKYQDSIKKSRLVENDAYYFLDSVQDVDKKWPAIMKYKPDHIKICLLDAAHYAEKRKNERMESYGLSPEVAAYIVKKAHAEGLRVFAHIETAEDARLCANIGVDVLAHLPGYGWNGMKETASEFCMTKRDAKLFKKKRVSVIPTFNIDDTNEYDSTGKSILHPERHSVVFNYKKMALQLLYKEKVPIALGSDHYGLTTTVEIDSLISNQVFSNPELLDIYCRQTAQHIFPNRKIGEIREGYECSFIVFKQNPLEDIKAIQGSISLSVRQGKILK